MVGIFRLGAGLSAAVLAGGSPVQDALNREQSGPGGPPNPNLDPDILSSAAPQNYVDWAARQESFEAIAATASISFALREPGAEPEELRGLRVTGGFFDVLRVRPRTGRPFTSENEPRGRISWP